MKMPDLPRKSLKNISDKYMLFQMEYVFLKGTPSSEDLPHQISSRKKKLLEVVEKTDNTPCR